MYHPEVRRAGTSAGALTWGFNDVFPIHDYTGGVVELYGFLAEVGEVSMAVFDELFNPEIDVAGVWAYDVDEECGQWIGHVYRAKATLPTVDECRIQLATLGRAMLAR